MPPKGMGPVNPSMKRKPSDKIDYLSKKPKVTARLAIKMNPETKKLPPLLGPGKGEGLMTGSVPVTEKQLDLLREDSRYTLEQLSSIIKDDDYED